MPRCDDNNRNQLMKFILNTPFNDEAISMDCNDCCENISRFAERVASGEKIENLMPEFKEHLEHWKDCREEFDALVAILKADHAGILSNDEQLKHLLETPTPKDSSTPSA